MNRPKSSNLLRQVQSAASRYQAYQPITQTPDVEFVPATESILDNIQVSERKPARRDSVVYTIARQGRFLANLNPQFQCGTEGQAQFEFQASIDVRGTDANTRFALDNKVLVDAANAFNTDEVWSASCEALAGGILAELIRRAEAEGAQVESAFILIQPNPTARLKIKWQAGDSLPVVVPEKTGERRPIGRVIPFGKYVNLRLAAVPGDYLEWLVRKTKVSFKPEILKELGRRTAAQVTPAAHPRGCGYYA